MKSNLFTATLFFSVTLFSKHSLSNVETRSAKNSTHNLQSEALAKINSYRHQHGVHPVKLNSKLSTTAQKHAEDLARRDVLSHIGSDGSNVWDRVVRQGYNAHMAFENVAYGQTTLQQAFRDWQFSPSHNDALLNRNAVDFGIAVLPAPHTQKKIFWVMVLAKPWK